MNAYTVKGEMRWEGTFVVHANTPDEAEAKVREGEWEDWSPENLCDWEPVGPPRLEEEDV
jgi:hypothetical protein